MTKATPAHRTARPSGFTLIEVTVAIVLSGILATVIFQLLQGQSRFTDSQTGRQAVQENVRGAMELIASELRAVPAAAIVQAGAHSMRLRVPRAYGTLCTPMGAGAGAAWVALPPKTMPADLPTTGTLAATHWGIAVPAAAPGVVQAGRVTQVSTAGGAPCNANLRLNGADVDEVNVTYTGLATAVATSDAAPVRVFLFQEIEYSVGQSSVTGAQSDWLMRANATVGGAVSTPQPLAGPLLPDHEGSNIGGVTFRYFCDTAERTPAQATATPNAIDKVRVVLAMRSRDRGTNTVQQLADSTTIHLRNSETACTP
ncbi:MAG TPA: type II secretion system protein [Longimicrobium sp.]|jgi:prepilin-type N-terminal cleavage/methylation domain-containing protein